MQEPESVTCAVIPAVTYPVQSNRLFIPRWRGPLEGYAVKSVHTIHPKLIRHHDFDDLYQEAFAVYLNVKARYANRVDNAAWFMALYKRCLASRWADLLHRACCSWPEVPLGELPESHAIEWHDGHLMLALRSLPNELGLLLQQLVGLPAGAELPVRAVVSAQAELKTILTTRYFAKRT